jgi:hypothetical protein
LMKKAEVPTSFKPAEEKLFRVFWSKNSKGRKRYWKW